MSDAAGNILGEAASLDPAIRERVIALSTLALDQAEHLIKHGDPAMRARLIGAFMTTFAKHMRTQETNEEIDELRVQLRELTAAVMGRTPGQDTTPELEEVPIPTALKIMDNPPTSST